MSTANLDHDHCDAPRCHRPWEVKYLGRRLCQKHWLKACGEEPTPTRQVRVRPQVAQYVARAAVAEQYQIADWLPLPELEGCE